MREHEDCDIWIAIDNLGKEDLLIRLAEEFNTLVVVSP